MGLKCGASYSLPRNSSPGRNVRSEKRRVGEEWRYWRDWSSDVCSSDLAALRAKMHDDGVQPVLAHFGAQRRIAAGIFGCRELLIDCVAIVRRTPHGVEVRAFIEPAAQLLPRQKRATRFDLVHGLILAPVDGDWAAERGDRLVGELVVCDLIEGEFLAGRG